MANFQMKKLDKNIKMNHEIIFNQFKMKLILNKNNNKFLQ